MTCVTTLLLGIVLFCATGAAAQPLSVRFLQSAPATVQEPPPTPPPAPSLLQPAGPVWTIDETLVAVMPGLDISAEVVKRLDAQK
jgi:hypothetical protein